MLLQVLEVSERLEGVLKSLIEHSAELGFAIIKAVIVFVVGRMIINLLNKLVKNILIKRNFDPSVKSFVSSLVNVTLTILLIISIVGALGVQTTSFAALLASAGVAVGMALSGNLSNFAGGVLILLLKPFKVGDYIIEHSHNNEGTVTEISIFYTKLLTVDNKLIVIPNGTLSNSSLTNVTNKDRRRVDLVVGIAYEADIRTAKDVIYAVAEKEEARIPEEKPVVYVDNLAASSVDIGLRVWVKTEDYWPARWRMTENIKYALDAKGISIPYQQIDVQIKQ